MEQPIEDKAIDKEVTPEEITTPLTSDGNQPPEKDITDIDENCPEETEEEKEKNTGEGKKYLYKITDKAFGKFFVKNSANGWWIELTKLHDLVQAYKIDATDEESCAYAGISLKQLYYFQELHPDFCTVKQACRQIPTLTARKTVVDNLGRDSSMAMDYLARKRKDEFSNRIEQAHTIDNRIEETHTRITELLEKTINNAKTGTTTTEPGTIGDAPSPGEPI